MHVYHNVLTFTLTEITVRINRHLVGYLSVKVHTLMYVLYISSIGR